LIVPKRILFVLPGLRQGGAEMVVFNILKGIDRNLFLPSIAWFHGDMYYPFTELKNIRAFFINKKKGFDLKRIYKFYKFLHTEKIDIINAHLFMPLFYSFLAGKLRNGPKLIYTEHSVWEAQQHFGIWKLITKYILQKTDAIVGVSPEITNFLQKRYKLSHHQCHTILNGVDIDKFKPGNKNGLRQSIGLHMNEIVIGMTGNFRRAKNHVLLINAFAKLASEHSTLRLVLVGQGFPRDPNNTEKECKDLVRQYGLKERVKFLGYRGDVQNILPCLDIFCLPSLREGLPMAVLEAMACGLPVLGTDVYGIRIVINSEQNGILVNSDDFAGFTNALKRLLSDSSLRDRLGNKAREDVEKAYSLNKFLENYNQLFAFLAKCNTSK
jgi:glycosyltransferase involved in cell wall biosynthesis